MEETIAILKASLAIANETIEIQRSQIIMDAERINRLELEIHKQTTS